MGLNDDLVIKETTVPPREIKVKIPGGVTGTLAIPHAADIDGDERYKYASPTKRVALLLHGQGGHRDYCYQKVVAHRLAAELGLYSFRIDFRGCGDSDDYDDPTLGRTLESDTTDIHNSVIYLVDGAKNTLGIDFEIAALIGHSRGSVAMFLWAMEQDRIFSIDPQRAIIVPNLINMSARFESKTVYDRYPSEDNSWEYLLQTGLRYGKWEKYKIPKNEIDELSKPDLTKLRDLSLKWSVLSVYGMEDDIIPRVDSAHYANHLNRGFYSHELQLIPGADHNFYGVEPLEDEDDADIINPYNLPLNKNKLVNYNYLAAAYIMRYLQPEQESIRFLFSSKSINDVSRWKTIDGISNFRDIGGWRVTSPRYPIDGMRSAIVRPNFIYRCANTNLVTAKGKLSLRDLKIRKVYDLRSNQECAKDGVIEDLEELNIERVFNPVFANEDASPQALALKTANLLTHWDTYVNMYDNMLEEGYASFQKMFKHIRDHPSDPFVFHCTAGKDRTGVFCMLVLRFVGVDKHTIAREYDLTSHGLKPEYPKIAKAFQAGLEKFKTKISLHDLEIMVGRGRKGWTLEKDGLQNLLSSRYEAMLATIDLLDEKYGGVVNYMQEYLKFTESDLQKIFYNLVFDEDKLAWSKQWTESKF
ncbi:uncharacterized protein CXQ87_004783 [Candidozyma duobushaemuli]|uniref:Tyrosine specific protein phosphatases domain-containing protein n=2 Tax=Candidozyma TaxID=3303203 RepID=A0ABX8IAX5_9ASCO|nr:uncharacterized protein CXQ87_004783 [[Candida] duobushaemulonis]PVH16490.1 hypothetical protein CXQ87_004783 [[Candida] duobushaemulonis]QWU90254.1 hypothetical protein CA3LBN_004615 [[Candida] haemuloni]